ncbi:MAG: BON domain-containing protein [Gemmataceae bacterium]|nr:BON domain-containing protein [Gemmataceae bacterium]
MKLVRRMAGYSPWAVAVALALESGPLALAQQLPMRGGPSPSPAHHSTSRLDGDVAANIAIAMLADPGLFRCHISARPGPEGIELVGFIPNEFIRQKAMNVAAAVCSAPIIDKMKIQPGMPVSMGRAAAPAELAAEASTLLAETLGDKVLGLKVVCPKDGRVEITGRLDSAEDKLRASKCLQQVNGCTHVVNRITSAGSSEHAAVASNIPLTPSMPRDSAGPVPMPGMQPPVVVTMPPMAKSETPVGMRDIPMRSNGMPVVPPPVVTKVTEPTEPKMTMLPAQKPTLPKPAEPKTIETASGIESPVVESKPRKATDLPVLESKPMEVTKIPATGIALPEIRTGTGDKPQKLDLMPELPKAPMAGKASVTDLPADLPKPVAALPAETPKPIAAVAATKPADEPKRLDFTPAVPKPATVTESPKRLDLKPELSKPVAAAPELPKRLDLMPEKTAPAVSKATDPIIVPPLVDMPKPVLPAPAMVATAPTPAPAAGKASISSSPYGGAVIRSAVEPVKAVEAPKPILPAMKSADPIKLPEAAKPIVAPGKASVSDLATPEPPKAVSMAMPELSKPTMPEMPKAVAAAPAPAIRELPKAVAAMPEAPKPAAPSKAERFAAPTAVVSNPTPELKPVTFAPVAAPKAPLAATPETKPADGPTFTGIIRQPAKEGSLTLDAETARRAVEDCCRGGASDVKVATGGARQLTVALKVASQSDWEKLYAKIKSLPELAGHSVIYHVQVAGTAAKTATTPPALITPVSATSVSNAPLLGVIRAPGMTSVEPEAARSAIEAICGGKADEISVRTTTGKQLAISMKVKTSADWDHLYAKIKNMPEVAGYSVIYNISVK